MYLYGNTASSDGACPLLRRTTGVPRKKGDRHRGNDVPPDIAPVRATEPVPLFPLTYRYNAKLGSAYRVSQPSRFRRVLRPLFCAKCSLKSVKLDNL